MNKRLLPALLALALVLCSCGALAQDAAVLQLENAYVGLALTTDEAHNDPNLMLTIMDSGPSYICCDLVYLYAPAINRLTEQLNTVQTEDEFIAVYEKMAAHLYQLGRFYILPEAEYAAQSAAGKTDDAICGGENAVLIGTNEGLTYLYYALDPFAYPSDDRSDEEIALISDYAAYLPALVETVELIPIVYEATEETVVPPEEPLSFSAKALDGSDVTEAIFAGKDLTVVNFWGTFCSPCINEMPELGEWSRNMPENVQIIGVVIDIADENDAAQIAEANRILEETGADFLNLIPSEGWSTLLGQISAVPTTLFVNSEGVVLEEFVIGANVPGYQAIVDEYLAGLQ